MKQEVFAPGQKTPAEQRGPEQRMTEMQILENSVTTLREKMNIFAWMAAHRKAGRHAAEVVVAMQKDIAEAQREVVQHHANLIARSRKMELTDRFQADLMDLTRRVEERTAAETAHFWLKLAQREDYYEEFFESRIRDIKSKVTAGEMTQERGAIRIQRYEQDRDKQQNQDRGLLDELMDANIRIVRKALADYQPT